VDPERRFLALTKVQRVSYRSRRTFMDRRNFFIRQAPVEALEKNIWKKCNRSLKYMNVVG
jgi:hypothetical protein